MRLVFVGVVPFAVGLVGALGGSLWWLVPATVAIVGMWLMRRGRCEHLYPSLLPSITQSDGTTLPARWFCCDCGESWGVGPRRDGTTIEASGGSARAALIAPPRSVAGGSSDQVA